VSLGLSTENTIIELVSGDEESEWLTPLAGGINSSW